MNNALELSPVARALPTMEGPYLCSYDRFIVAFSSGKDSIAAVLKLLDLGVPKELIELWHHEVDGREGSSLMDWPVTRDYCIKLAAALGLPLYFSWREGGFEREMLRDNTRTAPTWFETPEGLGTAGGVSGPLGTRLKFPQVSSDLSVRWCSAYAKVDVGATALRNQPRFNHSRTLFITGERAQESAARARYSEFEPNKADARDGRFGRHVDHWRPVLHWSEEQVWAAIERYRIAPHPAYLLGWGRVSCMCCIFGSARQWATIRAIAPAVFERIAQYEERFGTTIQRKLSVRQLADRGVPYPTANGPALAAALSETFDGPIFLDQWILPAGAYGEACGPT